MTRVLSLALAAFLLLAPLSTYAGDCGPDGPEMDGFEFGNSTLENIVGNFSLDLRGNVCFRNRGGTMEIKTPHSNASVEISVAKDGNVLTFQDLLNQTKGRGWKTIRGQLLGTYDGVEQLIHGRYGSERRDILVFLRPQHVAGVSLRNCRRNCREEYERIRDTLGSIDSVGGLDD